MAEHLPEDLEILWKPALFACLRANGVARTAVRDPGPPDGPAFVSRVRRQAPELDGEDVERVARANLDELLPRLSADGRSELAGAARRPEGRLDRRSAAP